MRRRRILRNSGKRHSANTDVLFRQLVVVIARLDHVLLRTAITYR
jgi:hypothetical protein